jgi:ATP-dependent protease HslVU (ClpYQ) peptidase subunit
MLEVLKEKEKIDYRPSNRIIQLIANNKDCIYGLTGNGDILAIYDNGRIFQITTYEDYGGYEDSEDSEDCNNS